jgi:hypothetical protein
MPGMTGNAKRHAEPEAGERPMGRNGGLVELCCHGVRSKGRDP